MSAKQRRRRALEAQSEWTPTLIEAYDREIGRVARQYALDCFPHVIEIITAEQMMDAYASIGMPVYYHHWSFGKHFLATERAYKRGQMGLAYEIVINSDPCIAYLQEENTMTMQALVIAHAAYGHNSFFKGNYLFRTWTAPDAIVDYLVFARNFIADCEEKYGVDEVEQLLDSCHALLNVGVDRYKRPPRLSLATERARQKEREAYLQSQVNELWRTLRRVCTNPTEEDRAWFPEIAGSDWRTTFEFAMRNFKDESFVGQYLSPQLMREFRLFAVLDDDRERRLKVEAIHDETGYRAVRSLLSEQYDLSHREPNIQVWSANVHGDRTLTLRHYLHRRRPLADNRDELLRHVAALWGFPVQLEEEDESGLVRPVSLIHVDRRRAVD